MKKQSDKKDNNNQTKSFKKVIEEDLKLPVELRKKLYNSKGFDNIEKVLRNGEKLRLVGMICDDPRPQRKTKLSFVRNWFVVITDLRVLFVSPTLVLGDIEQLSIPYKSITSASAGKWGSIDLNVAGSIFPIHFVLTGEYVNYQKEIVRIIEDAIF